MNLNNREWAIVIWSLVAFSFLYFNPRFKDANSSFNQALATLKSKPIIVVMSLMISYVSVAIFCLALLGIWEFGQIKNTLIWFFSVACLSLFKLDKYQGDEWFYKEFCLSNFRLIAIIHFILGIYTFNIYVELVLVPFLVLMALLLAVAQINKEHHQVATLITNIFSIYGLTLIGYTAYMVTSNFDSFANKSNGYDFFIPSLLTILYLPFIYFMLIYTTYERLSIRIKYFINDPELLNYAKYYAFWKFHFKFRLLDRWIKSLAFLSINSKDDIKQSIRQTYSLVNIERNPPPINTNRGWSPYGALTFIKDEGIIAENYHHTFYDEWVSQSKYTKTSEDPHIQNTVVYYVRGNATIATSLELNFMMRSLDTLAVGHEQLLYYAKALVSKALDRNMPDNIEKAIMSGTPSTFTIGHYEVSLIKEEWGNKALAGYDLEFCIKLIK